MTTGRRLQSQLTGSTRLSKTGTYRASRSRTLASPERVALDGDRWAIRQVLVVGRRRRAISPRRGLAVLNTPRTPNYSPCGATCTWLVEVTVVASPAESQPA